MLCQDNKFCESLVNVINFKGFTSLHFAVLIGNLEMVTILLEAGQIMKISLNTLQIF